MKQQGRLFVLLPLLVFVLLHPFIAPWYEGHADDLFAGKADMGAVSQQVKTRLQG